MNWDVFAESYKDFLDRTNSLEKKERDFDNKNFW